MDLNEKCQKKGSSVKSMTLKHYNELFVTARSILQAVNEAKTGTIEFYKKFVPVTQRVPKLLLATVLTFLHFSHLNVETCDC